MQLIYQEYLTDPKEIVKFYLSKINLWRQFLGLEKIVLIGHSFGGFMSAHYTLNYPDHVELLHLLSPIGVAYGND